MSDDELYRALGEQYAAGLERGGTIALQHLLEQVEEHRLGVEDPTSSGPTWDGLIQLLRDSLARISEGGWRASR